MNSDKLGADKSVWIGRNQWDVPMRVSLTAYVRFTRKMDARLRRLAACWAYTAAPAARHTLYESAQDHPVGRWREPHAR